MAKQTYPNTDISLIAHSFGTYMVYRALHRDDVRFKYVITAGSLLPRVPEWGRVFGFGTSKPKVERVINDVCAVNRWFPSAHNDFTKEHPCMLLDSTPAATQDQPHLFTVVYIGPHTPGQGR